MRKNTITSVANAKTAESVEKQSKSGYDLIFLGIILLLVFYALPNFSEVSLLSIFSAKFLALNEAAKVASNENTIAAINTVPSGEVKTEQLTVTEAQKIKAQEITQNSNVEVESIIAYPDDPQKGKWGKLPYRNDRSMTATVMPSGTFKAGKPLFKVHINVRSVNPMNPLTGSVQFHLHPTFAFPDPSIYVLNGEANLELMAWGAFTIGAEADRGMTQLELNLAELPEAPLLFRSS
ncbi:MAG: hypothetical protein J7621_20950 [Niastella sp.]|nr:hypothetical protein [Niastella sp.]